MIKIVKECVHCGLPCLGTACPNNVVKRYYCDVCRKEMDPEDLYLDEDSEMVCSDCILKRYQKFSVG